MRVPYLERTYLSYCIENKHVNWFYCQIKTLRTFAYFTSYLQITHSTLFIVWNCSMWPCWENLYRAKILRLQKRALRLMFFGDYKSHAVPFFISSNRLPLDLLYFKSVAISMHDVFNNLSPPQITNIFNFQSNVHPYNTRSSSRGNFSVQYSRLEKQNRSFLRVGVKVWNSLPVEMRHTPKTNFKRKIHRLILQKFSEAEDYIDLPDLIKN